MTRVACITGASGFLATQIIFELLRRGGWRIVAVVRSSAKAEACRAVFKASPEVLAFCIVADMQVPGAYREAVKGAEVIFHTASPFNFTFTDNEKDMLIPAREGALELLRAANDEPSVTRVVFTSSFAAVTNPLLDPRPGYNYTEADWNPSTWKEAVASTDRHFVYLASKTYAEKAVWDFVEKEKPNFVVISMVPPVILGPAQQPFTTMADINQSSRVLWRLMDTDTMPDTPAYVCVDVRDCALCHVLAAEKDTAIVAGKRYLTIGSSFSQPEAAETIRMRFPEIKDRLAPAKPVPAHYGYSSARAEKDLGITWRPLQETICDTFLQLLEVNKPL